MFIIDLTQGGFDLAQFDYVKNIFKNSHGLKIPFVFTKFSNMINGVITTMEVNGTPLQDLDEDKQMPAVLKDAQVVIDTFKQSIEKVFNDVIYFIYDPTAENYFADANLKVYYDEVP
jgi:predicted unusual protein kinase regulating ubiquinone biosynthesis (AarF/ABC1/UbiB family)